MDTQFFVDVGSSFQKMNLCVYIYAICVVTIFYSSSAWYCCQSIHIKVFIHWCVNKLVVGCTEEQNTCIWAYTFSAHVEIRKLVFSLAIIYAELVDSARRMETTKKIYNEIGSAKFACWTNFSSSFFCILYYSFWFLNSVKQIFQLI